MSDGIPDYYRLLNLSRSATSKEIDLAHRLARAYYHPDKWATASLESQRRATEMFILIDKAHEILSNEQKRIVYDELLAEWEEQSSQAPEESANRGNATDNRKDNDEPDIAALVSLNGLSIIDKRPQGGALWVLGGWELAKYFRELKKSGINFEYAPNGGRATQRKAAWYYKPLGK